MSFLSLLSLLSLPSNWRARQPFGREGRGVGCVVNLISYQYLEVGLKPIAAWPKSVTLLDKTSP